MAVLLTVPLVKRNYWPVFIFDIGKLTNNNNILSNSLSRNILYSIVLISAFQLLKALIVNT